MVLRAVQAREERLASRCFLEALTAKKNGIFLQGSVNSFPARRVINCSMTVQHGLVGAPVEAALRQMRHIVDCHTGGLGPGSITKVTRVPIEKRARLHTAPLAPAKKLLCTGPRQGRLRIHTNS